MVLAKADVVDKAKCQGLVFSYFVSEVDYNLSGSVARAAINWSIFTNLIRTGVLSLSQNEELVTGDHWILGDEQSVEFSCTSVEPS